MACLHIHDFITGSRIVLPRPTVNRPNAVEVWDILRPNAQAAELVARHVKMLTTMPRSFTEMASSDIATQFG